MHSNGTNNIAPRYVLLPSQKTCCVRKLMSKLPSALQHSRMPSALQHSRIPSLPTPSGSCWLWRHLQKRWVALQPSCSRLASPREVESACYLFAPAKDAQAGGHRLPSSRCIADLPGPDRDIGLMLGRLRPDWVEGGRPLSIPHKSITVALPYELHRLKSMTTDTASLR